MKLKLKPHSSVYNRMHEARIKKHMLCSFFLYSLCLDIHTKYSGVHETYVKM